MKTVQLFITCILDALYPEIGEAAVTVLERLGLRVEFPAAQTCCGQPGYNAGYRAEARWVALHFLDVFAETDGPIVTPSGSCAAMIKHGYPDLFADDPLNLLRAKAVAARTFEFSQYLVRQLGVTDVGARHDGVLTYHPSCHLLRGLNEREAPLTLLRHVRGATLVELPGAEECCGFGGLFSVKMADVSSEILARKMSNLGVSAAPLAVTCDAGCLTHINGGLHRAGVSQRVIHLAEILAKQ
ncbi:MAG: (Fe-S)-binding protein [Chloroflexi bacterium]|nr:(Fe-S)-binding protein [Chloroflexota bacterium]